MERISSAHNPSVKLARKLLTKARERERSGRILLDGVHLISGYAEHFGLSDSIVLVRQGASEAAEIGALIESLPDGARLFEVTATLFDGISPVDTPTGVVALVQRPVIAASQSGQSFRLLLDDVQNPGNLGAILRTAAATGADEVLLTPSCADPWSPRCLRGGMGAQFVLPLVLDVEPVAAMQQGVGKTVATTVDAGQPLTSADLSGPLLVLFGGEGSGLSSELIDAADLAVRIPLQKGIESLNVGAAVAMLCYERMRQQGG